MIIKEDSIQNFDHQSKRTDKQYEGLRKQCDEMKTTITNQTRQIGILHNLVLELKNSDGQLDAANAQAPQLEKRMVMKRTVESALFVMIRYIM